jgi:3-hydroxyisobutyrate dehydrogenase-like beta-hydroxyacid dehydrogenase
MSHIAFLGLGAMGSRMATRLLQAGHQVTVWNRSPAASEALAKLGAQIAPTPHAAAQSAEFVIAWCVMTRLPGRYGSTQRAVL